MTDEAKPPELIEAVQCLRSAVHEMNEAQDVWASADMALERAVTRVSLARQEFDRARQVVIRAAVGDIKSVWV